MIDFIMSTEMYESSQPRRGLYEDESCRLFRFNLFK